MWCVCAHEEPFLPLCVVACYTRCSFCVKQTSAFVKKMKFQTFLSLNEVPVKIRQFTWKNQRRTKSYCQIINTTAITLFYSRSPKRRKLPSLLNSLCLCQREAGLPSSAQGAGKSSRLLKVVALLSPFSGYRTWNKNSAFIILLIYLL